MLVFVDRNRRVERIVIDTTGFTEEDKIGGIEIGTLPPNLKNLEVNQYQELYIDAGGKPYYGIAILEPQPDLEYPETPEPPTDGTGRPLTPEERIAVLEKEKDFLQIALAESIEKQETDKISSQLAIAELTEALIFKGVL